MTLARWAAPVLILAALPGWARQIGSFDRTLAVNGAVDLDVRTNSGAISVHTGNTQQVQIHAVIDGRDVSSADEQRARDIEANPPIHQTGNSIRIDRLDDFTYRHISVSYELTVPPQTKVQARTGSGSESIESVRGPVEAETGSGSIRVSGVDQEIHARTGSGSIEFERTKASVDAETGSGTIRGEDVAGPVTARAGSGGIRLRLDPTAGFDVHAHTGSGRFTVTPPMTVQGAFGSRAVQGKIRGGGKALELATGSGSIHLD